MHKALTCLALACSLIASASQASSQQPGAEPKNPAIALGFAWLCPGCGHLYSGETTRGALIAAISVGAFATGVAVQFSQSVGMFNDLQEDCAFSTSQSECFDQHMDFTPILVGSAIALAGYIYGLIDAGPSARRMNAKHGLDLGGIDVKPSLDRDGSISAKFRIPLPVSW